MAKKDKKKDKKEKFVEPVVEEPTQEPEVKSTPAPVVEEKKQPWDFYGFAIGETFWDGIQLESRQQIHDLFNDLRSHGYDVVDFDFEYFQRLGIVEVVFKIKRVA